MTNDRTFRRASRWSMGLLATTMLTGVAAPALAQTESAVQLEEMVVTAQKRSENLQDVPISRSVPSAWRRCRSPTPTTT